MLPAGSGAMAGADGAGKLVLTKAKSLATQDYATGKASGLTVDGESHSYAAACNSPDGCIGAK
jgi:hypothetical protein